MRNVMWVGGGITDMGGIPMLGTGARDLTTIIRDVFRNGEQGFFYDPNDLSTMYQDAEGITAVNSSGQPVGLILDKSGRNNHAFQTASAARPILRDTPRRIDFDIIRDKLITKLSAQLTGCTVIRAIPNVGAQILTGKTIPITYKDDTDHCGLVVINRALTPSETSAITSEFNKKAGV